VLKDPFLGETLAHKLWDRYQLPIKICIYVKSNALLIINHLMCFLHFKLQTNLSIFGYFENYSNKYLLKIETELSLQCDMSLFFSGSHQWFQLDIEIGSDRVQFGSDRISVLKKSYRIGSEWVDPRFQVINEPKSNVYYSTKCYQT